MNRRLIHHLEVLLALAIMLYGAWLAYKQVFYFVEHYDDEGYMIVALQHYVKEGGLYTRTFAQYGPFYYYLQQAMHAVFRIPLTPDGGRALTLVYWLLSCLLAFAFTYRVTSRLLVSALVFLGTLMVTIVLKKEPGHPQEIVLLLTQLAIFATLLAGSRRIRLALFLLGCIGALMCLSKINTGVFLLASAFLSFICLLKESGTRTILLSAGSAGAILLPLAVMHANAGSWARNYCLLETACIALFVWIAAQIKLDAHWAPFDLLFLFAGLCAGSSLVIAVALTHGLSPAILLNGVILQPLRQPDVFFTPLHLPRTRMLFAALLLVAMAIAYWFRNSVSARTLGIAKVAIGAAAMVTLVVDYNSAITLILPVLALVFWDKTTRTASDFFPRVFLSAVVIFGFLQAYPVAGSQVRIGLAPAIAWAALLVHDGLQLIEPQRYERLIPRAPSALFQPALSHVVFFCLSAALLFQAATCFAIGHEGPLLNIPGATRVHVPDDDAEVFENLTGEIRAHCDVLFTMPGMYSWNVWSGVPTPDGLNITGWMNALTTNQQQEVLRDLLKSSRPCAVYNPDLIHFWMPGGEIKLAFSPLANYVNRHMTTIAKVSSYELKVPTDRTTAK